MRASSALRADGMVRAECETDERRLDEIEFPCGKTAAALIDSLTTCGR
jgi:hypothetical protein